MIVRHLRTSSDANDRRWVRFRRVRYRLLNSMLISEYLSFLSHSLFYDVRSSFHDLRQRAQLPRTRGFSTT